MPLNRGRPGRFLSYSITDVVSNENFNCAPTEISQLRSFPSTSSGSFYCAHPTHTTADTECHSQDCKSAELSEFGSLKLMSEFPIPSCHQLLYISKDWSSYNTTLRLKSSRTSYTVSSVEYKKLTSLCRDAPHLT
ncbi:unnamed protein product [Trichogramma brassicae]|uniref:Uncharacterized protein n=1 Tax=Trichogramma brassicae TaxID=86971 RepID=A0A6H5I8V5_9HYME|nr:unnamed protein product [Trichogramma brassicae]